MFMKKLKQFHNFKQGKSLVTNWN